MFCSEPLILVCGVGSFPLQSGGSFMFFLFFFSFPLGVGSYLLIGAYVWCRHMFPCHGQNSDL